MGKRINYEITAYDAETPAVTLYSNTRPGEPDAEFIFLAEALKQPGPSALVRELLGVEGPRGAMFTIDFHPFDRERVYRVTYGPLFQGEGEGRVEVFEADGVTPGAVPAA